MILVKVIRFERCILTYATDSITQKQSANFQRGKQHLFQSNERRATRLRQKGERAASRLLLT